MEDDDEFGDLYTDVLQNFPSSSSATPHPHQSSPAPPHRPIDLNLPLDDSNHDILNSTSSSPQTLKPKLESQFNDLNSQNLSRNHDSGKGGVESNLINRGEIRASEIEGEKLRDGYAKRFDFDSRSNDSNLIKLEVGNSKVDDGIFVNKRSVNFDINKSSDDVEGDDEEKNFKFDDVEEDNENDGIIPGLGGGGGGNNININENFNDGGDIVPSREGDEWDSDDSEDDLQIVLNDNNNGSSHMHGRLTGMGGGDEDEDDDEDGEPLVIVGDGDESIRHQGMEEPEWGEDGAQAVDGERKEMGEAGKANGGMVLAPKVGYSSQGYHLFHSQFKYVRPGAAPIPGAAAAVPGGAPAQVRPPVSMGPMGGRGRGEWRPAGIKTAPTMQKSFHSGFGGPSWGGGALGRGFGGGLDFTLPSHKTIFEVDIDSFEEKPWKHPGVDVTDFFNFGLNEDSWKDYCKQLEQFRLESTMQSKIRVYESGRAEQEYDPDMPPELAAAAGITEASAENQDMGKADASQIDLAKGSTRLRPPLPPGRAIQVESSYADRLPSMDTRPPRNRDSDAIIEIVCQDSVEDESSSGEGVPEQPENDSSRKDVEGSHLEDDTPDKDVISSSHMEATYRPGPSESRGQTPVHTGGNHVTSHEDRCKEEGAYDRSTHSTPSQSSREEKVIENQKDKSIESMGGKHSPLSSSPAAVADSRDPSVEKIDAVDEELVMADESFEMEGEEMHSDAMASTGEYDDAVHLKKQKLGSRVQQQSVQKMENLNDFKAARGSENSKVRSGSSRDYQNLHDDVGEEVLQDGRSMRRRNMKKPPTEEDQTFPRRDRDGKLEMERSRLLPKGREDSYPYRDWDPSFPYHPRIRNEGYDRRKERESSDGFWQPRDDDAHGRRIRIEGSRKRERGDEMGSRHWGNIRDGDRIDRDEHLYLRKPLDNGSRRSHYDKDVGLRHREKDDSLKTWHENVDDYNSKRRKDEEHLRRDQAEKEEALHSHRESTSLRKRERSNVLDQRKRDDQQRIRDNIDDHPSFRQKDDAWLERERAERHRERDDRHRFKQSHEEILPKREKEGREAVRSGRAAETSKVKDELKGSDKDYQPKNTGRHGELKRKDRVADESVSHNRGHDDTHGKQLNNDEKRSRQERSSLQNDRALTASDNHKVHDKRSKESTRKNKESEGVDHNASGTSRRNQDDYSSHKSEMVGLKNNNDQGKNMNEAVVHRSSSRKHKEDASSDDENQDSRRGRSKLERWASHKETDFIANSKSSSSVKVKEIGRNSSRSSVTSKTAESSTKSVEATDNQPLADDKKVLDPENKNGDSKPTDDRHLDTVAKLKKRSERFKLPMPSEKDTTTVKKMESDALPSSQAETPATEAEVKPERPPRKRRWVSSQN